MTVFTHFSIYLNGVWLAVWLPAINATFKFERWPAVAYSSFQYIFANYGILHLEFTLIHL